MYDNIVDDNLLHKDVLEIVAFVMRDAVRTMFRWDDVRQGRWDDSRGRDGRRRDGEKDDGIVDVLLK